MLAAEGEQLEAAGEAELALQAVRGIVEGRVDHAAVAGRDALAGRRPTFQDANIVRLGWEVRGKVVRYSAADDAATDHCDREARRGEQGRGLHRWSWRVSAELVGRYWSFCLAFNDFCKLERTAI